jgi:hypothetical protein
MLFLVENKSWELAATVEHLSLFLVFLLPIVLIWRFSYSGVLYALFITETQIILTDVLTMSLRSQQINDENREFWVTISVPILIYMPFHLVTQSSYELLYQHTLINLMTMLQLLFLFRK